jgi:hypothetical protein
VTLPPAHDHSHVVHNGKRDISIDQLALMQPGMDRLMAEVGPRAHRLYYAAKAGNWRLADYFFRSMVKQLKLCATSRPKYEQDMAAFVDDDCRPVRDAIRDRDRDRFEAAYGKMVDRANHYHEVFGKPYIKWVTPAHPPEDLDLTAGANE